MKYIAFLRAVNVGGHNIIKMDDLKKLFLSLGYKNVETVIQSGNVIFETSESDVNKLTKHIEKKLNGFMKKEIKVFIRTNIQLAKIVKQNPFSKIVPDDNVKAYVFFLYDEPGNKIKIPFYSQAKDVSVFSKIDLQLFMFATKIPEKASSPNDLIEKTFGVSATARTWNVVCKIVDKASTGR